MTPTFGAVGAYHILGLDVPQAGRVARFVRENYPVPKLRRTDRPLWRLDWEQAQTLAWLGESIEDMRSLASRWTAPAAFTKRYEWDANPVFQHQAMAVRVRAMVKLSPSDGDGKWRDYFAARRRADGTFNATPASGGSGGHLMNTLWGYWAADALGVTPAISTELVPWIRSCQMPSGGFTYSPDPKLGAVDDLAYTWAALNLLDRFKNAPKDPGRCGDWVESVFGDDGGVQDRPGGEPNPLAAFYALDCLRLLGRAPGRRVKPAARAPRPPIPSGSRVFTMQVEAPGNGSPREAVSLARALKIHIWAAKNPPAGWTNEAQRIARETRTPVLFALGNEEYGTYVSVPGLGTYSHLVDLVAPADTDSGRRLPEMPHPYPWAEFRETRLKELHKGRGRLIWQFLENEELTRALLDEACETGTYSAISTFHFGNENFLHSQPYLQRWYGRLPFVALQDAHGGESWWWGDMLGGMRTLFLAREPTWDGWLGALDRNHVMAVRHDAVTGWKTHYAGGSDEVRAFVEARRGEWCWWNPAGRPALRPPASVVVLRAGMRFEEGAPAEGAAVRVRLWQDNNGQGLPVQPRTELISLQVNGRLAEAEERKAKNDRYFLYHAAASADIHAEAQVRVLETGEVVAVRARG